LTDSEETIMKNLLAIGLLMLTASPGFAWNEKGHYVVCRLAWLQMTDPQRAAVTAILKRHPHYDAYLTKSKPNGFAVDEWAFMRAGPWPTGLGAVKPAPMDSPTG
jgi:hypothetical protein